MTADGNGMTARAAALARDFDRSFAEPAAARESGRIELLLISIGGDRHAIHLSEIAGLHADRAITRVPGPLAELCGLVSLRGSLIPVYDLRLLLGYPAGPPPRWLIVAAARPVGLGFDELVGHTVVPRAAIIAEPGAAGRSAARRLVEGPDGTRSALLDVPSITGDIAARAGRVRPAKER
jgi:chemotaxis signal transduction protein